jgi:diguanylate cyclase (GGDEF)-like protein/PAS domain S-box-containing protein
LFPAIASLPNNRRPASGLNYQPGFLRTVAIMSSISSTGTSSGNALTLLDVDQLAALPQPPCAALYPAASMLMRSRTVRGGLQNVLEHLVQSGGWALGVVWQVKDAQLRYSCHWGADAIAATDFVSLSRAEPFRQGDSLPRTVLQTGQACIVSSLEQGAHMVRFRAAQQAGLKSALAWPLIDESNLMGVIEFYGLRPGVPSFDALRLLDAQCRDIARFLEARRFDERLRTKHAQLAQAQRIARLAYWEYIPASSAFRWTNELADWLGGNLGLLPVSLTDYLQLVHPEDREELNNAFRQLNRSEVPRIEIEHRILTPEGALFHLLLQAEAEQDDDDSVQRISGTLQDLTEQKRAEALVQASERRWQAAFRNSPLPSMILDTQTCQFLAWNDELLEFLGLDSLQVQGRTAVELGLWSQQVNKRIAATLRVGQGTVRHLECRMRHKGGDRFLLVNMENVELDGRDCVLAHLVDITSRKRLEQTLRLTAAAVEHSGDALVILSQHGRIVSTNPAFSRITGYSTQEALDKSFDKLILASASGNDTPFFGTIVKHMGIRGYWEGEIAIRRSDATHIPILLSLSAIPDDDGCITHYVSVFSDISRQKDYEERLRQMALHDSLTGLPNRRLFIERGNQALLAAERHDQGVSVLFIDLDKFKPVNDAHGHAAGDSLLLLVAERLAAAVRSSDTVARLGGDEFVILLPELSDTQALKVVAEKIIHALDEPFQVQGQEMSISASVGISRYPVDGADIESLLRAADDTLYKVKEGGRNGYAFNSEDPV